MNLLDLILIALMAVAGVGGYRLGFLARSTAWIGAGVGIALAIWATPFALELFASGSPAVRLVASLVVFFLVLAIFSGLGESAGLRLRRRMPIPLRDFDRGAGAVAGAAGVLVVVWLLLPAASQVPGAVAQQVRNSAIVRWVSDTAPEPPNAIRALRNIITESGFPEVFADLRPAPDTGPPPSQIPVPQEVVQRVTAATVNVEANGCGRVSEGSGWAVAQNTVITNAHVVAGVVNPQVRRPDGAVRPATVVAFDDDRDLAVLDVPGLEQSPLQLADARAETDGAVVGYPGGQNQPRTAPARVRNEESVVGRDIYGEDRVERRVVFAAASLRRGDSGAPIVDPQGNVVGVVFAIAADRSSTAFALADDEIRAVLQAPRAPGAGRCL